MPITTPTVAPTADDFLGDYAEFTRKDAEGNDMFSASAINYWLTTAVAMLNQSRFGRMYYQAVELFMAHNLALEAWSAQGGGQTVPGIAKGSIAGTAAGDVSVSYNNIATLELDAGHWNYTTYGQRLMRLIRMFGAGPVQVGIGCGPSGGGGWSGPPFFNFPNPSN